MKCQPVPISQWNYVVSGPLKIILAKTACQIQQGLQGAKYLPSDTLLLFLNIFSGRYFHTQNCHFMIDIIALNNDGKILNRWLAKPGLKRVGPTPIGTTMVLETNTGWMDKNSLHLGDSIPFVKLNLKK